MAVLWPLEGGCFGRGLAASAVSVGAAWSLWRGVWAAGGETNITATQQGAAPDRLQLRSLRSFLPSLSALPAAGELICYVTGQNNPSV